MLSLRRAVPATLLLLLAGPLRAERLHLPCKIPGHGVFQLTNDQEGWGRDGKAWRVTVSQTLRFASDAGGNRLTLGPISTHSTLDPAGQQRLAAAFGPTLHRPLTLRIDERGQIVRIEDVERHWQAYLAMVEGVARDMEKAGQPAGRARATLSALAASDEPTRIGLLAGQAGPLLRHCGQAVEAAGEAGLAVIAQRSDTAALSEVSLSRVDPLTGLTRSIERRVTIKAQPDKPHVQRWRFDPVP